MKNIEKSWASLGSDQPAPQSKDKGTVKALEELASGVEDQALKNQLKNVENQLRASNQQQQEARDQAIRASLNLGAFLCTKMLDDGQYTDFLQKNYASNCKAGEEDPTCGMRKTKLDEQSARLHKLSRYYASSLVESGSLYGQDLLQAQVPVLEGC